MKKLLTWLLCLMMLVSAVPALAYTTGTYTGTGTGMLDKIEVAVTFDADTITGIEVVSCNDTPGVCDAAVEKIPAEIVKYQSLGVDVATSATFTSNGILEAVADAVKQAGGDPDAALRLLLADKMEELLRVQVEAVKNIKIDKVTVWDGANGEKSATANFLSGIVKSIPPMQELFDMAGMQLPSYLGTPKAEEAPAAAEVTAE